MRLPWRTSPPEPDLSPEMRAWIDARTQLPEVDRADIERARLLVAARLHGERTGAAGGSLRRRLALGGLGGGALWSGFVGFAAAHQVATVAVGLGLLVAGSTAAEVTGVRPAVSEFVTDRVNNNDGEEREGSSATAAGAGRGGAQLVLEGTLEGISDVSLTLRHAAESTTLAVGPQLVAVGLDGRAENPADLIGLSVVVAAHCDREASGGAAPSDCEAQSIRVVRSQGQGSAGGEHGQSADAPGQGGTTPGQSEDAPGQGGTAPGRSEDAPGQTGETPGQADQAPPGQGGPSPQGIGPPSTDPPGQGGTNPGQGADPPAPGGENPGQGGDPPGQGGDPPGQGGGNGPPNQ